MNLDTKNIKSKLAKARQDVDKSPTEGQIKAGNYKKGHISILGFNISIENPKGSYRRGKDSNGKEWKTLMHNDYGYFTRTVGKDGDAVDVFIGPNLNSEKIFPIDQYHGNEFDETKVMLGFDNKEEAKAAYLSNYEKGWKGFKYITEVDIDTFKKWLYDGYRQRKPFAKYVRLTESYNTTIKNIVKNSTLCEAVNPNDEIWYRGYNSQFGFNGRHEKVLWLTDDIDYARCYGNRVAEVVIDGNKLNPASIDEMDGFCRDGCEYDYYDGPNDDTIVAALKEGLNCFCFEANDDSSYCMCLWDRSVIKSIRELSEEETNAIEGYEGYDIAPYRTSFAEYKRLNEGLILKEDYGPVEDAWENYDISDLLYEFLEDKRSGRTKKHWNVIPAAQYHNLLRRYMENPAGARIPNIVNRWMDEIIIKNTLSVQYITDLAGHSSNFPYDDCENTFGQEGDYSFWSEYLNNEGFYDWSVLPDGSNAWSDYGLEPIWKVLSNYKYDTPAEETLILINRVLDIGHCRGDLASAFIEGGSHSCDYISNSINEDMATKYTLNEAQGLKSKKLYDIFKTYGREFIAKHYDSSEAMDLHNVSDNDVVGVFKAGQLPRTEGEEKAWINQMGFDADSADGVRNIKLGKLADDGQILYAVVINRNANYDRTSAEKDGGFKDYVNKQNARAERKRGDGSKNYQWKDNSIKFDVMDNPYRKEWSGDAQQQLRDKMAATYGKRQMAEAKKINPPKDIAAAVRKGMRDADIEQHGKATDFRTTTAKNPKAYSRKEKHKKTLTENDIRQIIRESIEEFYKGSKKERAAYENACDCLYYGYGFKFWFERNSQLLDGDIEFAKRVWEKAKEDMADDF